MKLLVLVAIIATLLYTSSHAHAASNVDTLLRRVAAQNGLPANLVMAIAWHESGWKQTAVGRSGEIGIMQILPSTARGINARSGTVYNVYSAEGNVALGARYLRSLKSLFQGNLTKTISAYNQGEGAVAHYGIKNWRYVNNIYSLMTRFK